MSLAWGGYSNGQLPFSAMLPIKNFAPLPGFGTSSTIGSDLLMAAAQKQLAILQADFLAHFGYALSVSEAYRVLDRQTVLWSNWLKYKLTRAAYPGTSNHGWGRSVDFGSNVGTWTSQEHLWLAEVINGKPRIEHYGFRFTVPSEGWHADYIGSPTITAPVLAGTGTTVPIQEDDLPYTKDELTSIVRETVIAVLREDEFASVRNDEIAIQVKKRAGTPSLDAIAESVWGYKTADMPGKAWQVLRDSRVMVRNAQDVLASILAAVTKLATKK